MAPRPIHMSGPPARYLARATGNRSLNIPKMNPWVAISQLGILLFKNKKFYFSGKIQKRFSSNE
jgi:hypothetical protein